MKTQCEHCSKRYAVADEMAGRRVRCKACGQSFEVIDIESQGDWGSAPVAPAAEVFQPGPASSYRPIKRKPASAGLDWRIIAAGAGAVVLLLGIVWWAMQSGGDQPVKKPTAQASASAKPQSATPQPATPPSSVHRAAAEHAEIEVEGPMMQPVQGPRVLEDHELLAQFYLLLKKYAADHGGEYPQNAYDVFNDGYANQMQYREQPDRQFIMTPNMPRHDPLPADVILAHLRDTHSWNQVVLMGDGSVRDVGKNDWDAVLKKSQDILTGGQ